MDPALGLSVDPQIGPLYQQIFDQVVERIRSGAFSDGFRLPPTRTLARGLGVHRNTVVRAYELLEEGGFVASTVGRGTFVRSPDLPEAPTATAAGGMPWGSLTSRAADCEPLSRFDRIADRLQYARAINLTRMQPPTELLPIDLFRRCVSHVLSAYGARALRYAPREGVVALREAIAAHLHRRGVPARAEEILVTSGSQQALDLLARALIDPEDTLLCDNATYVGALNVFSVAGARLVGVPSDLEGPEMSALERLGIGGAKALYLMPDAQNPTGLSISTARRRAIVAWSRRVAVPLIEDAYVSDLHLDAGQAPVPLRALDGDVLHVGSFSKNLIPALRVGYVVRPEPLGPRLVALKHAMDLGTSVLLQHALAEFLDRGYLTAHLERVRVEYRRRRDALVTALQKHLPKDTHVQVPSCGLSLFVHLPPDLSPMVAFEAASRAGVIVTPSSLNSVSGHDSGGGLRITYCGEPPRRLTEGAKRLGGALRALGPTSRDDLPVMETI